MSYSGKEPVRGSIIYTPVSFPGHIPSSPGHRTKEDDPIIYATLAESSLAQASRAAKLPALQAKQSIPLNLREKIMKQPFAANVSGFKVFPEALEKTSKTLIDQLGSETTPSACLQLAYLWLKVYQKQGSEKVAVVLAAVWFRRAYVLAKQRNNDSDMPIARLAFAELRGLLQAYEVLAEACKQGKAQASSVVEVNLYDDSYEPLLVRRSYSLCNMPSNHYGLLRYLVFTALLAAHDKGDQAMNTIECVGEKGARFNVLELLIQDMKINPRVICAGLVRDHHLREVMILSHYSEERLKRFNAPVRWFQAVLQVILDMKKNTRLAVLKDCDITTPLSDLVVDKYRNPQYLIDIEDSSLMRLFHSLTTTDTDTGFFAKYEPENMDIAFNPYVVNVIKSK